LFYVTGDVGIREDYKGKRLVRKVVFYYPKKSFLEFGFPNDTALKAYYKIKEFGNYHVEGTYFLSKQYSFLSRYFKILKNEKVLILLCFHILIKKK